MTGLICKTVAMAAGSPADPAAPLQIYQIIYGEPVDEVQLVLLQPGYHGVKTSSFCCRAA